MLRRAALALLFAVGLAMIAGIGSAAAAQPPTTSRPVEILRHKPSGFWTSNRPAQGGAYRWRLLGIGVVLASGFGVLMWRLTRRANAAREGQPTLAELPRRK